MRQLLRRLASFGVPWAAGIALAIFPAAALSGVVGSPHDLSPTSPLYPSAPSAVAPAGVCSPCHVPHAALDNLVIWPRSLADYRTKLKSNGDNATKPNYLLTYTLQCYDCHDYHGIGGIDDKPEMVKFATSYRPQDIAFGFTKVSEGNMTPDPPGGSVSGYYENTPPDNTLNNYGADPSIRPKTVLADLLKTGGHYFKYKDPDNTVDSAYDIGDKLPCSDCHDPHLWSSDGNWQAFVRKRWPAGSNIPSRLPDNVFASPFMVTRETIRKQKESRYVCVACHGYAGQTDQPRFSEISQRYSYSAGQVAAPKGTFKEHLEPDTTPCVKCHTHNAVECGSCHGYPPGPYPPSRTGAKSYPGSQRDPHAQHIGHADGQSEGTSSAYAFECTVCHATSLLGSRAPQSGIHNNGGMNIAYDFSSLGFSSNPPDNVSAGGMTCRNVYCHSNGGSDNTMGGLDNYYRSPVWGTTAPLRCNGCHGAGTPDNAFQTGMPDYPSGDNGSTTANSHATHVVANRHDCSVCHAQTVDGSAGYQTGRAIKAAPLRHVNGKREVEFDGVRATGTYDNTRKTCAVSCHGVNPQWGGAVRGCSDCHLGSGADTDHYLTAVDNLYAPPYVRGNLNDNEWRHAGHGKSSGNYDKSGNPAANLMQGGTPGAEACYYCHDFAVPHGTGGNPFRLVDQSSRTGYESVVPSWNATCLVCHSKTPVPLGYDPPNYDNTVYDNQAATRAFVDNNHNGTEHSADRNGGYFCWDCHDPHGDRNAAGSGNIYMVQKGRLARRTDRTYGILGSSGVLTTNAPIFTDNGTGTNYADNVGRQGICQVCHTQTSHYTESSGDGHNAAKRCTTCHLHDAGFRGLGGPDVGQYFDRLSGTGNYYDNSRHPLRGLTDNTAALRFTGSENCLGCHYAAQGKSSDECLMCHFENGPSGVSGQLDNNHMNGQIELADPTTATPAPQTAPRSKSTVLTIQQYDDWCLLCHTGSSVSLGGRTPSDNTIIGSAAFTAGRHRGLSPPVGCIYCHQPHGSGNVRIVREYPDNRRTAGPTPMKLGVYPANDLASGAYGTPKYARYWSRSDTPVADNNRADADDENAFCNKACHTYGKDKLVARDNTTGNYLLYTVAPNEHKKIYLVNGGQYTKDNTTQYMHKHPNGEIVSTDSMVDYYKAQNSYDNNFNPSFYKYPGAGNALPASYSPSSSPLPFFPDYQDVDRDFLNGYSGLGRIKYRYTCSTCHNPHGAPDSSNNGPGGYSYPDLRMRRVNPNDLCTQCHR